MVVLITVAVAASVAQLGTEMNVVFGDMQVALQGGGSTGTMNPGDSEHARGKGKTADPGSGDSLPDAK